MSKQVARPRRPAPPEIPDEYDLTAQWRTGPANAIIGIEVWGRRSHRDALLRLIDDAGSMDAGSVTAGGTDNALVIWTKEARAEYGAGDHGDGDDWLNEQAAIILRRLANLWGTT